MTRAVAVLRHFVFLFLFFFFPVRILLSDAPCLPLQSFLLAVGRQFTHTYTYTQRVGKQSDGTPTQRAKQHGRRDLSISPLFSIVLVRLVSCPSSSARRLSVRLIPSLCRRPALLFRTYCGPFTNSIAFDLHFILIALNNKPCGRPQPLGAPHSLSRLTLRPLDHHGVEGGRKQMGTALVWGVRPHTCTK